jgi:hypothetical protein
MTNSRAGAGPLALAAAAEAATLVEPSSTNDGAEAVA